MGILEIDNLPTRAFDPSGKTVEGGARGRGTHL
jgi:hypothetical protein